MRRESSGADVHWISSIRAISDEVVRTLMASSLKASKTVQERIRLLDATTWDRGIVLRAREEQSDLARIQGLKFSATDCTEITVESPEPDRFHPYDCQNSIRRSLTAGEILNACDKAILDHVSDLCFPGYRIMPVRQSDCVQFRTRGTATGRYTMTLNAQVSEKPTCREDLESRIRQALLSTDSPEGPDLVNQYCEWFPGEAFGWIALGEICLRRLDFAAARNAFHEALACDLQNDTAFKGLRYARSCIANPPHRLAAFLSSRFRLSDTVAHRAAKLTVHTGLVAAVVALLSLIKGLR